MDDGTARPVGASTGVAYRERLHTPWWWYPIALVVAAILAAEFHIGGVAATDWIPWLTLPTLALVVVWFLGRSKIEIVDGEVRVRGAHLALEFVSGAVALDGRTLRRVVGREGDPAAYLSIRPWVGPGVQLWLDDADDPTPYWLVSSRHPERLVEAVRAAI